MQSYFVALVPDYSGPAAIVDIIPAKLLAELPEANAGSTDAALAWGRKDLRAVTTD